MRHPDREITDPTRIKDIMQRCDSCKLGLYDAEKDEVYVVPMSFGYDMDKRCLYFHGAKIGRRYELVKQRSGAGFEMDTAYELVKTEKANGYTARYQSIIGHGHISEVVDDDAKKEAMLSIMEHYSGHRAWELSGRDLKNTALFRLDVDKMSCKFH